MIYYDILQYASMNYVPVQTAAAVTKTFVRETDTEPAEWMAVPLTLVVVPSLSVAVPS